jgi:hypothetical protein
MARPSLKRYLSVLWDRDAARRLEQEAEASLGRAGKEGAEALEKKLKEGGQRGAQALTGALQREFKVRMAKAQQDLAEGLINERQFRKEGEKAAAEFNKGLTSGIQKLQASQGGLTTAQQAGLASRFKVPRGGGAVGLGVGLGPLAGIITAGAAFNEAREAVAAADRMETAIRKLGGTSRLTGVDLKFLQETSDAARESFRLSIPIANDLTSEVVKLTERSGDINQTGAALSAFLDIGAARGLGAAETLQAVGQAILGIDEGTDKLFGKNPSTLYKEYADRIGTTAARLTDQQKSQALLDATLRGGETVRGEYLKYLTSAKGEAEQNALKIEEMRANIGRSIQPLREFGGVLKEVVYANLVLVAGVLGKITEIAGKTFSFTVEAITTPGEVWRRLFHDEKVPTLRDTTPERMAALGERIAAGTATDALGRPYRTPAQRRAAAAPTTPVDPEPTEEEKRAAEQRVQAMRDHLDQWRKSQGHYDLLTGRAVGSPDRPGIVESATGVPTETEFDRYLDLFQRIDVAAEETAARMADAFQDTFALMIDEGATVGNFFEGMARSAAGAVGQIIAEFAAGKAKEHFASAIGAAAYALGFTSTGNFASASAAWAAAAEHTAAGLAFSALAGAAAAGGQAVRSRAPGSTFDAGLSTARDAEREPGQVIVYIDPFNPSNPVHVQQIGKGMELDVRLGGKRGRG